MTTASVGCPLCGSYSHTQTECRASLRAIVVSVPDDTCPIGHCVVAVFAVRSVDLEEAERRARDLWPHGSLHQVRLDMPETQP